jgi:hypothetical protein
MLARPGKAKIRDIIIVGKNMRLEVNSPNMGQASLSLKGRTERIKFGSFVK